MASNKFPSALVQRYATNPEEWRPYDYAGFVSLPVAANSRESFSIQLNQKPYILIRVCHQITALLDQSGNPINDGQYLVQMSETNVTFSNIAAPADLLFGANRNGESKDLVQPVYFGGNDAIQFDVTNLIDRVNRPSDMFRIDFVLQGWMYHGDISTLRKQV
jgi:hypothetical protein